VFSKDAGLLQGTVELLVLKRLSWGPMHGYGIASWIERATADMMRVEEGSLYPALYRMTRKGWIQGEWGVSENNRKAKYYRLTKAGRRQLEEQVTGWHRLSHAVTLAVSASELSIGEVR
jgi:PadR family transcriptional regulator, regulatory protein PadR